MINHSWLAEPLMAETRLNSILDARHLLSDHQRPLVSGGRGGVARLLAKLVHSFSPELSAQP